MDHAVCLAGTNRFSHHRRMNHPIGLGAIGLGRAFTLMLPTWVSDKRIRLVAGFDPRLGARESFAHSLGGTACEDAHQVCAHPDVEWVYVASPHGMHLEHVLLAASHRKHVLVEKPMALTLRDCQAMIEACEKAGTQLVIGHSHSFDGPVRLARQLIEEGSLGRIRMIQALQYTDFLYRPRRAEELQTSQGGGVVFSQAAHQIDMVRLLAGGLVHSVRAVTGRWDARRPTEGAYSALLNFDDGVWASLSYNGYGHFDSDVWMDGIGELGQPKNPLTHSLTHQRYRAMHDELAEAQAKAERNFGGRDYPGIPESKPAHHQHFGPVIVSCDQGDMQLTSSGVIVHGINGKQRHDLPEPTIPRQEVVDEIWGVSRLGHKALHDGRWSLATLEVCLALIESAEAGRDIMLRHQVSVEH